VHSEKVKLDLEKSKLDLEESKLDIDKSKLDLEKSKLDIDKSKLDLENRRLWVIVIAAAMFCMMAFLLLKSGTDWLGTTGDKLIASVEKTSDKVQQASHVLSASIGGSMIASGRYSPFQLVVRNLWSFIQNLAKHRQ